MFICMCTTILSKVSDYTYKSKSAILKKRYLTDLIKVYSPRQVYSD